MLQLRESFTDGMIDDRAILVHNSPSVETAAEERPSSPEKGKLQK